MEPCKSVDINGTKYVRADLTTPAEEMDGMKYVIVRTYSAGVFAGYLKARNGKEVDLVESRRLWSWSGAMTLSDLAMRGTTNPDGCKFPLPVTEHKVLEAIEILTCTQAAKDSIASVPIWTK